MAALMLKYRVSKIPDVRPNNKYVYVHGFNFSIWIIMFSLFTYGLKVVKLYKHKQHSKHYFFWIVFILQDLVVICIDCFLMFQVLRYARGNKRSN